MASRSSGPSTLTDQGQPGIPQTTVASYHTRLPIAVGVSRAPERFFGNLVDRMLETWFTMTMTTNRNANTHGNPKTDNQLNREHNLGLHRTSEPGCWKCDLDTEDAAPANPYGTDLGKCGGCGYDLDGCNCR
jgi:hypothetical protein